MNQIRVVLFLKDRTFIKLISIVDRGLCHCIYYFGIADIRTFRCGYLNVYPDDLIYF